MYKLPASECLPMIDKAFYKSAGSVQHESGIKEIIIAHSDIEKKHSI